MNMTNLGNADSANAVGAAPSTRSRWRKPRTWVLLVLAFVLLVGIGSKLFIELVYKKDQPPAFKLDPISTSVAQSVP